MKKIDTQNNRLVFKEELEVTFASSDECIEAGKDDDCFYIRDADSDRVQVFNRDIDALIRALEVLKGELK